MATRMRRWLPRTGQMAWLLVLLMALGGGGLAAMRWQRVNHDIDLTQVELAPVLRMDLFASVRTAGRVESAKQTLIECELESLTVSGRGSRYSAGGASTILSIIPDGSTVEKDQVLCELDSSDYMELVRQQEIKVQEEKAELDQAQLELEVAQTALLEYSEGLAKQASESFEGKIALAQADYQRMTDRFAWTVDMCRLGYLPQSRLAADKQEKDKAQITLEMAKSALHTYQNYTFPKFVNVYEARIASARSMLAFQELRHKMHSERLDHFRKQVELCTVRAPHGGFVIYANEDDDDTRIELGARVRQKQDLFLLPDLQHMEVEAVLNESIIDRIRNGQQVRVRLEALPNRPIEGRVTQIAPLPITPTSWRSMNDVKNYAGRIVLDSVPEGTKPGMTAEVEILTSRDADALVIPPSAVRVENGTEYCVVVGPDGVSRREVKVGKITPDHLQVTEGLAEGEQVVVQPSRLTQPIPDAEPARTHAASLPTGPLTASAAQTAL
jgi:HlyD family secretion protein